MASRVPKTSAERTSDYRARKRAAGYRLMQRWVPDLNNPAVREELRLHCEAINREPNRAEDQAYLDYISDWVEPEAR